MPSHTFATSGRDLVGHCIDNGRLRFLSVLGVGAYGVVYLAVDLHAPKPVYLAVKCLLRAGLDSRQRHFQRREIALHGLASRHPNVVTLHKVFEEGDYVFAVMDYCDDGDLFCMITDKQRYIGNDAMIKKVFLQIVDAVEYCHSLGIYHRDLKPENILCTRSSARICIADFGLATSEKYSNDFGCGSTFYLSPECQGGLYERVDAYSTELNDVWSLGVILVNLACGRNPWRQACAADDTFRAYVADPDFLRTILPISRATNRILKALFALEPTHRPTLAQLRAAVLAVDTFTMTDDELRHAHAAARAAAAAVRPIPPPAQPAPCAYAPPQPAYAQSPQHAADVRVIAPDADMDMDSSYSEYDDCAYPHPHIALVPGERWSASSTFADLADAQFDDAVFAAIDFAAPVPAPLPIPMPMSMAVPVPLPRMPQLAAPAPTAADLTPAGTPALVSTDPYALARTSSASSSSAGVSLPPTPEFEPADRKAAAPAPAAAAWHLVGAKPAPPPPALLHVSPASPSCEHFVL